MRTPYPHPWIVIGGAAAAAMLAVVLSNNNYYREYWGTSEYIAKLAVPKKEAALIELDFGGGKRRMFRGAVDKEVYPLEVALSSAAQNGNFSFQVKDEALIEIAGIRGGWSIYRNGEEVHAAWDKLSITGGDKYTFRYEK